MIFQINKGTQTLALLGKVLFLLAITFQSWAQRIDWAQRMGSTNNSSNFHEGIEDVAIDAIGNVYVIGEFAGTNVIIGNDSFTMGAASQEGAFVAKFTPQGQLLWRKTLYPNSGFFGIGGQEVAIDGSGNIIAGCVVNGSFQLDNLSFSGVPQGSYILFKMDGDGTVLWHKLYEGNLTAGSFLGLEVSPDNGIVFAGTIRDSVVLDTVTLINDFPQYYHSGKFIAKVDQNGNLIWTQKLQGLNTGNFSNAHRPSNISIDGDGNTYMITSLDSGLIDGVSLPEAPFSSNGPTNLLKFNSNGHLIWYNRLQFSSGSFGRGQGIQVGTDGVYFFRCESAAGIVSYNEIPIDTLIGIEGTFFGKIDTAGNLLYHALSEPPISSTLKFKDIAHANGKIYLLADVKSWLNLGNIDQNLNFDGESPAIISFDETTQKYSLEELTLPSFGENYALSIGLDADENLVIGGHMEAFSLSADTFTLLKEGAADAFLIHRLSCKHLQNNIVMALGDSLLCGSNGVELVSDTTPSALNYQWFFGSTALTGANDTSYFATLAGAYSVRISDSTCAVGSDTFLLQSGTTIPTSFTPTQTQFCESDPAIVLSGGSPAGDSYAGSGVSAGVFDPGAAGPGNHSVSYIFTQPSGCVDTLTQTFNVLSAPGAFFFPSIDTLCEGQTVTLTGGFPAGGQYSGTGVTGNQFNTTTAGIGSHTLYYSRTNGSCSSIDSIAVFVESTPTVTLNLGITQTCEAASPLALSGGSPAGGTYSGTGVSGGFFIPSILAPGAYSISYSVSTSGCAASQSATITVDSFPVVSLPALDSICLSATNLALDHGLPAGGTYLGTGVSGFSFDAGSVSIGSHSIQYVFANACAADTATNSITVIANPTITASITGVSCPGDANGTLAAAVLGSSASFSFLWSTGDTVDSIASLLAGTYSVTATGGQGCEASNAFTVAEPSALVITLDSVSDVVCNGFTNGAAFATISGGTAPYSALWSTGSTIEDPLDLPEGTHQLLVTDANGCSDSLQVTITELDPVTITLTVEEITCFGAANASIDVQANGGDGTYSYAWNTGSNDSFLILLDTGTYVSTVSDANSCFRIDTVVLAEPDSLSIGSVVSDVSCFGASDGSIALALTGGTVPYQYAWSNGGSTSVLSSITAGNYTVTVTDSNGCFATLSDTVNQPDSLVAITSTIDSIDCNGNANGALQVLATGGSSPYSYAWNTGDTIAAIDSLSAGNYTVTVTDFMGCEAVQSVALSEPSPVQIQFTSVTDPSCFGTVDGAITALASGGTAGYSYAWNTSASGATLSGLGTGTYSVTVTDQRACLDSLTVTLIEPAEIEVSIAGNDLLCFEDSSGTATSTVLGGVGSWSFEWSNGDTSIVIDALPAGSYALTVTDSAGCVGMSDTLLIDQPDTIGFVPLVNTIGCYGDSSGSILVTATGGSGTFGFNWSNGVNTNMNIGLDSGTYSLTVTDANGCEKEGVWILTNPLPLAILIDSMADPLCFGDSSGALGVTGIGGTGAMSYVWNDGGTDSLRTALPAGMYTVTVTDANGCDLDVNPFLINPQPLGLQLDSLEHLLCFGDSLGYLEVSAFGGTGSLVYAWNDGNMDSVRMNLPAGMYTVTVTDENGCDSSLSQTLFQPSELIIATNTVTPLCDNTADGFIGLSPQGGTSPYSFSWSTGDSIAALQDLDTGLYVVTVTDVNNCLLSESFDLGFEHLAPVFYFPSDTSFCADTTLMLTVPVDDAIDYSWSTGAITQSILVNFAGVYAFDVLDSNGCFASDSVTVSKDSLPTFSLGDDSLLCAKELLDGLTLTGPAGMSSYAWSTGAVAETEDIFGIGMYGLLVTDSNGCEWTDSIAFIGDTCLGVDEIGLSQISVYPNPNDGRFFVAIPAGNAPASLKLFTGSGRLITEASGLQAGSMYVFDREPLAAGVYFLRIEVGGRSWFEKLVVQ